MNIGVEAESRDRGIAAPRRRATQTTPDPKTGPGHLEAPVLIRLPDLYPSARDDAAVARLAGLQRAATSESCQGAVPPPDFGSSTIVSSAVSTTTHASGAGQADAALSACSVQTNTLSTAGESNTPPAQSGESLLPRILLAAERHDLGAHVFRVLMITLLIASLYLVFERTRHDGSGASPSASSGTGTDWELSDSPGGPSPSRSPDVEPRPPEKHLATQTDAAPPHRVAKRSNSDPAATHRDPQLPNRDEHVSGTSTERREPLPASGTRKILESQPANESKVDALAAEVDRPIDDTSLHPSESGNRDDHDHGFFPSTPVNFDDPRQQPAGSPAWNVPEIPWESSSRYQEPAGTSSPSPRWETNAPSNHVAPAHVGRSPHQSGGGEEFIPPYTPVTLRPRSEPQYPSTGDYSIPSQPHAAPSSYLPPTSFSPPASTSSNASGWPMETYR